MFKVMKAENKREAGKSFLKKKKFFRCRTRTSGSNKIKLIKYKHRVVHEKKNRSRGPICDMKISAYSYIVEYLIRKKN